MNQWNGDLHVRAEQWLLERASNWAAASDRDLVQDLLQEGRAWRKVFGHLSLDPDTAGNLINEKMTTLEQEVRRITALLVDERLALRTLEQEVRDLRANRDLFKATAELYERQYQQDIQPQLAAAEAEVPRSPSRPQGSATRRDVPRWKAEDRAAAAEAHREALQQKFCERHITDIQQDSHYGIDLELDGLHARSADGIGGCGLCKGEGLEAELHGQSAYREAQITALRQMEEKYYRVVFRLHGTTVEHGGSVIGVCDQWPCRELPRQHPAMLWGPPDADPGECALCCEPAAHPDHVAVDALSVHPTQQGNVDD